MAIRVSLTILNQSFFLLFFAFSLFLQNSSATNNAAQAPSQTLFTVNTADNNGTNGHFMAGPPSPSSLSPPPPNENPTFSSFKPSIVVIVGVLTTMFSITFLLLLYAKHCKSGNLVVVVGVGGYGSQHHHPATRNTEYLSVVDRKNSGIDRAIVESLPVFRFGSLLGQKDGLECAICLNRFECSEVLRLLPKCKHAFHVECVDTWLDAHSTCPLCRYRVDPEDILLVLDDTKILSQNDAVSVTETRVSDPYNAEESGPDIRRVSGRHSSAGERGSNWMIQIVVQKPEENTCCNETTSFRRSLDDWWWLRKKRDPSVSTVGWFDRPRKDGLLLTTQGKKIISSEQEQQQQRTSRFEHRIIVSPGCGGGLHQRWSDVQPSKLLYLRSEMIISDSRRFSSASGSRPSVTRQHLLHQNSQVALHLDCKDGKGQEVERGGEKIGIDCNRLLSSNSNSNSSSSCCSNGRRVINSRSVSEITGLSRYSLNDISRTSNDSHNQGHQTRRHHQRQAAAQAGLMSRWVAWISQLRPAVGSECNAHL
ncbi:RING-H2 finger protein ATL43 [Cannabis sativa]|uniref:RING-H2 finger protein ATL43 n=1 Tax=Cannabis sativa TaxID=3483 RepID=UPI0011DFC886|nr:RING-H2 finger protein ATL43 [Cannabis sativa]